MEASSLRSILFLSHSHKQLSATTITTSRSYCTSASKGDSYGHDYDGKLVNENMVILRMRMQEIKMVEMATEAPSNWSEWEKNYCVDYVSDVCEAIGLLQRFFMNTRPSLALGIMVLLMLSMSMSMSQLLFHVAELAKGII
ncbi:unnamed protein product [Lupinus luteus]|uniref:Uncharacterized protein n=1 Tax=Lupinus luteus TaxID=3873 RepID=A0AAV1X402_LUPLU